MGARHRRSVVLWAGLLLAGAGIGCDWTQVLGEPPPPTTPQPPVVDAAAPADASSGYDAMCRHYCETLEETDLLYCVSSGRYAGVSECQASVPTADTCFDLRCRPQRVDVSLCLTQCDAVATYYNQRCPAAGASTDPLCPTPTAAHDSACRAGCAL